MNTPGRIKFSQLPVLSEVDDSDEVLFRDVDGEDPAQQVGRLSIATLRAAMGGGSPDRIESPSGDAFSEATDSFRGLGTPASQSEAIARGAGASSGAYTLPKGADKAVAEAALFAGTAAMTNGASIKARYDSETGERRLVAEGAPLEVPTPTAPNHAATKGYVDAQAGPPDRITGGAGTTYDETQLGVGPDATGSTARLLRGVNRGDVFLEQLARENSSGTGYIGWRNTRSGYGRGYVEWGSSYALIFGSHAVGNYGRVYVDGINGGNVYFDIPGANAGGGHESSKGIRLGSHISHTPNIRALPSNVNSILHGIKLGVDAHDALAEMPAPPDLEWWDPTWTAIENVDSVSNVECSYTRTYRAAGGSLVTLEGTIEVTPDAAGQCAVQVDLPIARVGSGLLAGTAMAMEVTPPGHVVAAASVDSTTLTLGFDAEGVDPYLVGFRASYRAA